MIHKLDLDYLQNNDVDDEDGEGCDVVVDCDYGLKLAAIINHDCHL